MDIWEKWTDEQKENLPSGFELFGGHFSSIEHAKAEYNLECFYYKREIKNEEYLKSALKNDGLTDEQIEKIVTDEKYIKYIDKNKKPEEGQDYMR